MNVAFAGEAEADLEGIGDFIARDNPSRAVSFVRELREQCAALGRMPEAFPVVCRRRGASIRRRPYRGYLIFYEVQERTTFVVRILHGARDYGSLIGP